MPHLSKQRLQKETYVKINRELGKALEKLVRVNKKEAFMYELLTFTERVMLAKRLAIILMLDRDNSYYEIQ
ncbi:MAG TPA: Trp family transcriptional regulator, partial [Candidatus Paceibacterota bacterium]